jgi:hypothetical protein
MLPRGLIKFLNIGLVAVVIGLLVAAFPNLGFTSIRTGYSLLGIALVIGSVLIWAGIPKEGFPDFGRLKKVISTMVLMAIIVVLGVVGRRNVLEEQQSDVSNNLKFAAMSSADELNTTVITVTNGGHTNIQYRFVCHVTELVANHGGLHIKDSGFRDHERQGVLDSGEDSQADDCLSGLIISPQILDCVDINVRFFYSLTTQPRRSVEKDHGFVARKRAGHFEWEDRAVEQEKSDCAAFAVLPQRPALDERLAVEASTIEAQDAKILQSHAPAFAKKLAARLSSDILEFGVNEKPNMRKSSSQDVEKDGFPITSESQQQFGAWAGASSLEFHSMFDSRLKQTFQFAGTAHINVDGIQQNCSVISMWYPPTIFQTRLCGIGIGELAAKLPED